MMTGIKYVLSMLCVVGAGLLLQAEAKPATSTFSESVDCKCGITCPCREDARPSDAGEQENDESLPRVHYESASDLENENKSEAEKKPAAVTDGNWKVGDTIIVDGFRATITKIIVEPNGKLRLQWVRPRAGHWSYPGSIDDHLKSQHGVDTSGMTREQMLSTHDALHESGQATPLSTQPRMQSPAASNCPGGTCPPRASQQRRLFRW
jgi:hypothetical protein